MHGEAGIWKRSDWPAADLLNLYGCKSPSEFEPHRFRVNIRKQLLEEELALVENYIKFLDRRRTGGILYIPDEFAFPEESGYDSETESIEDILVEYMMDAVQNPESASALIPIILRGPADLKDKVRHIDLDNEFYATLCARAYKLKAQIEELDKDE